MHRPKSKFGENLYEIEGAKATPKQVVDRWASESSNFDYKTNRCHGACGHYTQIIWRDTKEVGCAVARGGGPRGVGLRVQPARKLRRSPAILSTSAKHRTGRSPRGGGRPLTNRSGAPLDQQLRHSTLAAIDSAL